MAMKDMFASHGTPVRLTADNMPFNNMKFKDFASKREFEVYAFLALLEFRNFPISGMDESPAELLMSRQLRKGLPTSKGLQQPRST